MSRSICGWCGMKRNDKFLKQSPVENSMFCFKDVKKDSDKKKQCIDKHIDWEKKKLLKKAEKLGFDIQRNLISEFKMYNK